MVKTFPATYVTRKSAIMLTLNWIRVSFVTMIINHHITTRCHNPKEYQPQLQHPKNFTSHTVPSSPQPQNIFLSLRLTLIIHSQGVSSHKVLRQKCCYEFVISHMFATCPAHLILYGVIILITNSTVKSKKECNSSTVMLITE